MTDPILVLVAALVLVQVIAAFVPRPVHIASYGDGSAASAETDAITAKLATDALQYGLVSLPPQHVVFAASALGANPIAVPAGARVVGYVLMGAGPVEAQFTDGPGGAPLSGRKFVGQPGGGVSSSFCPVGWFDTTADLSLHLTAAVPVEGEVVYIEVGL